VVFLLLLFFCFSITFTSPSKSNLPTHLSRTRGLGWLWRGLLHREFVQLARNTEPALSWSRSLCSTSFCNLSFVPQGRCQFYFLFTSFLQTSSVQSPHLSALAHVYDEYTKHSVSQGPVWVDNVLYHKRRETINTMRRIVSQSLNSVQVVNDEGEVVELSKDLVRHAVTFLSDVDLMSAFTATAVAKHDAFRALGSNSVLKRIPLFFFVWSLLCSGRNSRLLSPKKI
jgi:hypothetical protein